MEILRDLVREIAIIVLLAGFLEMLLPTSSMKSFVKVVMGLFIIVTVLSPISSLLGRDIAFEVNSWRYYNAADDQALQTIMTRADSISRESQAATVREYEKRLAQQVQTVAKLVDGVGQVEAQVSARQDKKTGHYGGIDRIVLLVGAGQPAGSGQAVVEPVQIEVGQNNPGRPGSAKPVAVKSQEVIKTQLQQTVANFYGLKQEQIEIVFR